MDWHMAPLLPEIDRHALSTLAFTSTLLSKVDVHGGFCAVHFTVRIKSPATAGAVQRRHAIATPNFTSIFTESPWGTGCALEEAFLAGDEWAQYTPGAEDLQNRSCRILLEQPDLSRV
jgi:hypothetical protein